MGKFLYEELTKIIIGAAFAVHNALGKGLQEKAYENALQAKLRKLGLTVEQQKTLPVFFENSKIGEQQVDLLVENKIILEVKATSKISKTHVSQLLGYLKNTRFQLGLLLNFGSRVEIRRFIYTVQNR